MHTQRAPIAIARANMTAKATNILPNKPGISIDRGANAINFAKAIRKAIPEAGISLAMAGAIS